MNKNSALLLIVLALGILPAYTACTQTIERRLGQYHCTLRLPDSDFSWLEEEDLPGVTLACRDQNGRFVILILAKTPPGFHIDARQGAAFEKGMAHNPGIKRLGGGLTNFLGLTCYEIRGRIETETARSLTVTRMFAANGFLYDLQAMIPEPPDGGAGKFDDLFAAFRFTDQAKTEEAIETSENSLSPSPASLAPSKFAPTSAGDSERYQREPPKKGIIERRDIPWIGVMSAGSLLGVILVVLLLRMSQNNRRVL